MIVHWTGEAGCRAPGDAHKRQPLLWLSTSVRRLQRKPMGTVPGEPSEIETLLVELGRSFYARGWALGTSGNFSAVVSQDPFRLAITSTVLDKGSLKPDQLV